MDDVGRREIRQPHPQAIEGVPGKPAVFFGLADGVFITQFGDNRILIIHTDGIAQQQYVLHHFSNHCEKILGTGSVGAPHGISE